MNLLKYLKNPQIIFKKIYFKYFVNPKFIKNRNYSFKVFLKNLNFDFDDYLKTIKEIKDDNLFNEMVNIEMLNAGLNRLFPFDEISWPYFIYYLVRKVKPEIIVETGVWYGVSSSIILRGLNENKKGMLYSIDLPAYFETGGYKDENPYRKPDEQTASLPCGKNPGFIIPEYLKERWKLILGDSKQHLPILLEQLKIINIFLHDSLHSYENMKFEFELAINYLHKGSYMLSDNIDWNNAFYDFCIKKNLKYETFLAYLETPKLKHNFGAIVL